MILNMGIIQLPNLKDYWSTSDITNIPFFRTTFARKRFLQIYGTFHPGAIDGTKRKDKLQQLLDIAFQQFYIPSQQIAIDESIIAFKGNDNDLLVRYFEFLQEDLAAYNICDLSRKNPPYVFLIGLMHYY